MFSSPPFPTLSVFHVLMLVAFCKCHYWSALVWNSLDHQDHLNSSHILRALAVQSCSFLQGYSVVCTPSHDWKYPLVPNLWKILRSATCIADCYHFRIGVGTHFTVTPSRQVVREKVVWGGLSLHLRPLSSPMLWSPLVSHMHYSHKCSDPNSRTLKLLLEYLPSSVRIMLKSMEINDQTQIL